MLHSISNAFKFNKRKYIRKYVGGSKIIISKLSLFSIGTKFSLVLSLDPILLNSIVFHRRKENIFIILTSVIPSDIYIQPELNSLILGHQETRGFWISSMMTTFLQLAFGHLGITVLRPDHISRNKFIYRLPKM